MAYGDMAGSRYWDFSLEFCKSKKTIFILYRFLKKIINCHIFSIKTTSYLVQAGNNGRV